MAIGLSTKSISNFYPRSPCGERLIPKTSLVVIGTFLSTLSLRRATNCAPARTRPYNISIHALLAESDNSKINICYGDLISIHALLAESDVLRLTKFASFRLFLSTLSLRRATAKVHKTVGHFCAYETNFMGIASSC